MKTEKLLLTEDNILADHHEIVNMGGMLFNGEMMENTPFPWKGGIAVPKEVVLPGTKITGQLLVIDLKGKVRVDEIKVMDTHGQPTLTIYTAAENIFEPKHITDLLLDWYGGFKVVPVGEEVRYILLNNPKGAITGIGEVEVWGEYIEQDKEVVYPPFTGKKVKDVIGVTSHDYDHVRSSDAPHLANIKDINPTLNWRLYCEINKNVKADGTINLTNPAPGGLTIQDAIDAKERGGITMLSPVQNIKLFMDSYADAVPQRTNLPFFVWDKTKSWEENREAMYDPQNYSEIRDIFVEIVRQLKDKAPESIPHVILQFINELDKKWFWGHHYMNAFQVAAMHSMIWDAHQGKYGIGIKDICPELKVAWLSQAYNNPGYTKLANLWFKHHRTDGIFCADVICSNSYCNSASGTQHAAGAYGIPPENTFWEERLNDFFQFSRSIGREFALTEFGFDVNGTCKNTVVVEGMREDLKAANTFPTWNDWAKDYEANFWPKYRDQLLERQAQWDLRSMLIAMKYCDFAFIYHIRDNAAEGSQVSGTYSSCGLCFNRLDQERGQLELKPSGIAIKNLVDTLGEYVPVSAAQSDGYITYYFESPEGKTDRFISWQSKEDSMPQIFNEGVEDPEPPLTPEREKLHRQVAVLNEMVDEKMDELNNLK